MIIKSVTWTPLMQNKTLTSHQRINIVKQCSDLRLGLIHVFPTPYMARWMGRGVSDSRREGVKAFRGKLLFPSSHGSSEPELSVDQGRGAGLGPLARLSDVKHLPTTCGPNRAERLRPAVKLWNRGVGVWNFNQIKRKCRSSAELQRQVPGCFIRSPHLNRRFTQSGWLLAQFVFCSCL